MNTINENYLKKLQEFFDFADSFKEVNPVANFSNIYNAYCGSHLLENVKVSAVGFSQDEALLRAQEKLSQALHFRTFDRNFFLGKKLIGKVNFLDSKEQLISEEESELLFDNNLKDLYQLDDHCFDAFYDFMCCDSEKVLAIPFTNLLNNTETLIPSAWIQAVFGSNGEGCGSSEEESRTKAIQRIISQSILIRLITAPESLPKISKTLLPKQVQNFQEQLEELDKSLFIFDATFNGIFPAMIAVLSDHKLARIKIACATGYNLSEAISNATLDVLAKESYLEITEEYSRIATEDNITAICEDRFGFIPVDLFTNHAEIAQVNFPNNLNYQQLLSIIKNCIEKSSNKFLCYELTREDRGLFFTKLIIPGFSEIADPSLFEEKTPGIFSIYRDFLANISETSEEEQNDFWESLKENSISDQTLVYDMLGLFPSKDYIQDNLTLAELKFFIALKMNQYEEAWKLINEILNINSIDEENHSLLHCCRQLLWITLDEKPEDTNNYNQILTMLYNEETIEKAKSILESNSSILELFSGNPESYCKEHDLYTISFTKIHSKDS